MKAEWRIGKVDSVKLSRDEKVREVNIAYKIMKEGIANWSHSIVTRPVREVIKLFEINDSTFAEEMKAAYTAARNILKKRGALEEASQLDDWSDAGNKEEDEKADLTTQPIVDERNDLEISTGTHASIKQLPSNDDTHTSKSYKSDHHPFLTCLL